MELKFYLSFLFILQLVDKTISQGIVDVVKNHSILIYRTDSQGVPCVYCTDEHYSVDRYYQEECYKDYLQHQYDLNIISNNADANKTYHRLCVPFTEAALYKSEVQCHISPTIENGTTQLFEYYYTFQDRQPAHITEPVVGTQIKINCDEGYIPNTLVSQCSVTNQKPVWNPLPECIRIGCFGIPHSEHGQSSCFHDIVANGTMCNITCSGGFIPNQDYTQCLEGNFTVDLMCISNNYSDPVSIDVIIGSVVGSVVAVLLIVVAIVCLCKHKPWKKKKLHVNGVKAGNTTNGIVRDNVSYHRIGENVNVNVNSNGQPPRDPEHASDPHSSANSSIPLSSISSSITVPYSNSVTEESELSLTDSKKNSLFFATPLPNGPSASGDASSDEQDETDELHTKVHQPLPSDIAAVSESSQISEQPDLNPSLPSVGKKVEPKTPVENEDIANDNSDRYKPEPVENEDFSDLQTLDATGSDLIKMANGACEETYKKEIVESDNTCPKVLNELPSSPSVNSGSFTLPSNPTLTDFNIPRTERDKPNEGVQGNTAIPELSSPSDAAYGSSEHSVLESDPSPLFIEKDTEQVQDTGRGTMEGNITDSIPDQ